MRVNINGQEFEFRSLTGTEFVLVQDTIGNPGGEGAKLGEGFRLACQSAIMHGKGRDLNEALEKCPGAILQIGGRLYSDATSSKAEILGE